MAPLTSYGDFAAVAEQVRASALAAVLHQAQPGKPFVPIAHPDTRAALTTFRRVFEEHAGVQVIGNQLGGGWSYQPSDEQQLCVYGFSELPHALLAAVRSVVAPLTLDQKLETPCEAIRTSVAPWTVRHRPTAFPTARSLLSARRLSLLQLSTPGRQALATLPRANRVCAGGDGAGWVHVFRHRHRRGD